MVAVVVVALAVVAYAASPAGNDESRRSAPQGLFA